MALVSATSSISAERAWQEPGPLTVHGAPEGADALIIAQAVSQAGGLIVHIARDASRAAALAGSLAFFAPQVPIVRFPAWDCLPYDRLSPSPEIVAARMAALSTLNAHNGKTPLVIVTTVNAMTQRVPSQALISTASFSARPGASVSMDELISFLTMNGYARASTVREPGDYAVRGGLIDLFPPGTDEPLRLDFFGDTLETIRAFDPNTQMTTHQRQDVHLSAASEALLNDETISRFRSGYLAQFGAPGDDPVYEAVSAGRRQAGMEHWLPLFYDGLETVFDHLGDALVFVDHLGDEAARERFDQIADYYETRREDMTAREDQKGGLDIVPYRPMPPDRLYITPAEWDAALTATRLRPLTPFSAPEGKRAFDFGAKKGRPFTAERAAGQNVFEAVAAHIAAMRKSRKVIIAGWTAGSADRLKSVLADHDVDGMTSALSWPEAKDQPLPVVALPLENGFETDDLCFIAEQDILGDRLVRRSKTKRADNFLTEASSLSVGDLIVHVDHGIGRYDGLETLEVGGAPHDCLILTYQKGDKLFLPVENIELLSRFGSDDPSHPLDRLGGGAWQSRKAKMRERIRLMAEELIAIAAKRAARRAEELAPPSGAYDEFAARFPYTETDDQLNAIDDVISDLSRGRPMDRLVCGDVGFGKTEVALRAAFVAAMSGRQVAVIAPTTLLVRQHFRGFVERFQGFPVKIRQLSRFVSAKEASATREGIKNGDVDIVIGTHALLSKHVAFRDLGLLIIDEEQHFGVKHKERLKEFRGDTHVLTLTATPIPRTLQLSMAGIRDLSLIATPPVDRLAVRTTIGPFDPVVARETLLREHYRGGQSFYVVPRLSDIDTVADFLRHQVPEIKFEIGHGQMSATELEDVMNGFYDGKFDVLLATTIIESGIDVPTANTLVVHRADMFGLAQLYQIRGRVGRSKQRAYAYLTTSPRKKMTEGAEKRLKVLQSLDTLGAGFTLASHDLDIRGAGNLLGEEQSGNVKDVGVELYQHMLEEAVANLRDGNDETDETWSPTINIGTAVLIPDHYVADLDVRMSLYRRLSDLTASEEIEAFAAELIDRFGPLPSEVDHLLQIVGIKMLCRRANVEKIDAGPKGAVIGFRKEAFPNPIGLVNYLSSSPLDLKVRADQKLVFKQEWPNETFRLKGCRKILTILAKIAEEDA
ncbi:transcription-repair coupling factor [Parvularcula bermudensis HTCC2503]|uniref:Transcription-repair-coupling factor n=1 Tax=Parvularcula bermudensis (strain ATCC BAA-594 / HTCC2503 / KCTC 12087) TaxID=314260 RepID=E0TB31_PARBH|nr:transcription-repair coupling factor [Parvularcula bermudensis]ADM08240.1 transcription-repair coupling factor [Parvularcula bermudensis HTCC2503]